MAEEIGILEDDAIPITWGEPMDVPLTLYVDEEVTPQDLTDASIAAVVRWKGGSIVLSDGSGITVDDAAGGAITVRLTAEQSAALPLGQIPDLFLQVTLDGDDPVTWLKAPIKVERGLP